MAKVRKGLADVTDGEKWEWLGSGKTSFTGERKLDMSYGISTTIEASLASKLSVGISTSVAMEAAVKAEFGAGLSYTKGEALSLSQSGDFSYQNSYAGTVGADDINKARLKAYTIALGVLLGLQTGTMIGLLGYIAHVQRTTDEEVVEVYSHAGFPMSMAATIMTIITTVSAALMAFMTKIKSFTENNNPAAALTMDADQGLFLGMNRTGKIAGVTMNPTAVDIGIADAQALPAGAGVAYSKPAGSPSVVGLAGDPGTPDNGGTRLQLNASGDILLNGTGAFQVNMVKKAGGGDTSASLRAQSIDLQVTDGTGNNGGSSLALRNNTATLGFDDNNNLQVANDNATLLGGTSATKSQLTLTSSSGILATGGNQVKTSAAAIELKFGASTVKLDATGFSIGSSLQVLQPGAPALSSADLQKAVANVAKVKTLRTQEYQTRKALNKLSDTRKKTDQNLQKQIISLRSRVDNL